MVTVIQKLIFVVIEEIENLFFCFYSANLPYRLKGIYILVHQNERVKCFLVLKKVLFSTGRN